MKIKLIYIETAETDCSTKHSGGSHCATGTRRKH